MLLDLREDKRIKWHWLAPSWPQILDKWQLHIIICLPNRNLYSWHANHIWHYWYWPQSSNRNLLLAFVFGFISTIQIFATTTTTTYSSSNIHINHSNNQTWDFVVISTRQCYTYGWCQKLVGAETFSPLICDMQLWFPF